MRQTPLITKPAGQLDVGTHNPGVKRSFAGGLKRRTRTCACSIGLPRTLLDKIILLMFTCCLFAFLDAFFGFAFADEDLRESNSAFARPHMPLSVFPLWTRGSVAPNEDQKARAHDVSVDWHGNYELPTTTSASASIPQDAFPDPTPTRVREKRGRELDEGSFSMTTKVKKPADIPFALHGSPHNQIRSKFEDFAGGIENHHGLYPVAPPPRTALQGARTRRFGGCLAGGACL